MRIAEYKDGKMTYRDATAEEIVHAEADAAKMADMPIETTVEDLVEALGVLTDIVLGGAGDD